MNNLENNVILDEINKLKDKKIENQYQKEDDFSIHIRSPKDITGKQALLMIPITKFFTVKEHITQFLDIIEGRTKISLRLIDWFVTNYSKKNNTFYNMNYYKTPLVKNKKKKKISTNFDQYFNVFNNYKSQLKAYSKLHFDPFCRRTRISFYYQKDKSILTTVGQLNFFKWTIENYIIDYMLENIQAIESDMNFINKSSTEKKKSKTVKKKTQRKPRKVLSITASKSIIKHNYPITLSFD
tara:strand:- start:142 stop:861 length:720 start_codon:yes stop_codon:yes gene_type:complete